MRIDLHTHSTASDGTESPAQLVASAARAGLDVVAITDHDTAAGWLSALAARPDGLTIVPGVEMSCVHATSDGRRISLHLLAYLLDPTDVPLQAEWARLGESRRVRGRRMVDNLAADGYPITWDMVSDIAAGAPVGRPHLGRALVAAGVVPDVDTAFRDLLNSRRPYYVRKPDTDVFAALELVRAAGGIPVFAHPLARRRGPVVPDETIAAMAAAGLVGLEIDHPDQDPPDRAHAAELCAELGLIGTGSSDYHGTNKSTGIGIESTTADAYEALLDRPTALRPVGP